MKIEKRSIIIAPRKRKRKKLRFTNKVGRFFISILSLFTTAFVKLTRFIKAAPKLLKFNKKSKNPNSVKNKNTEIYLGRTSHRKKPDLFKRFNNFIIRNKLTVIIASAGCACILIGIFIVPLFFNATNESVNAENSSAYNDTAENNENSEAKYVFTNVTSAGEIEELKPLMTITVTKGDEEQTVYMREGTVIDALAMARVTYDSDDEVAPKGNVELTDGLNIVVVDIEIETTVKTEAIEYKTVEKKDSSLVSGKSVVTQKGVKGEKELTYRTVYRNGVKSTTKLVSEEVTKNPVTKIVNIGTASQYSNSDIIILAKLIYAEAGGESDAGQIAVGSVVLNRIASSKYPNTMSGVVNQSGQFASLGSYSSRSLNNARKVCSGGKSLPSNVMYFRPSRLGTSWGSRTFYKTIDNHNFFK
ncbi:MAG: G5 domain-containing protein [Eubacteriales bacterium]